MYSDKTLPVNSYLDDFLDREDREEKRRRMLSESREDVKTAYSTADHPIMQAISTYKEIEKVKGIIYERLEEWYSIYFPELKNLNQDAYADVVSAMKEVGNITTEDMEKIAGEQGLEMLKEIEGNQTRPKVGDEEYKALKELAKTEKDLSELQKTLDKFIAESVGKTLPNVTHLIEPRIAAELLLKAGSVERLATFPASTIQLLGAEKALFKHLKFGSRPPKYGVLFKLPQLSNASKKQRGRLARTYATKISIAARADAYTKRFIADKLKEQLDKAVANIMKNEG